MEAGAAQSGELSTRAGFVALVGRPNVGKSTLMNAFLGEKLSIVTPRAQTTREPVTGILTGEGFQIVFVDTPGLLEARYALQQSMQEQALGALNDADLALLLLDATRPDELPEGEALAALQARRNTLLVAINKVDAAEPDAEGVLEAWCESRFGLAPVRIAAASGTGVAALRDALVERLPESPFFYAEDEIAVQSTRFFVAEFIRETVFELYEQEIPYASVVRIEEFREGSDPLFIRATVYVERETQKGIIVGRQGTAIRELGARSRHKIEAFLGTAVYLDLWVKALPGWRRKASALEYLGYRPPASAQGTAPEGAPPPRSVRAEAAADRPARRKTSKKRGARSRPGKRDR
jgi:GTPase